jgi:hypothetical protein
LSASSINSGIDSIVKKLQIVTALGSYDRNPIHPHSTADSIAPIDITQRQDSRDIVAAYKSVIAIIQIDCIVISRIVRLAYEIDCIVDQIQAYIIIGINPIAGALRTKEINGIVKDCYVVPTDIDSCIIIGTERLIKSEIEIGQNDAATIQIKDCVNKLGTISNNRGIVFVYSDYSLIFKNAFKNKDGTAELIPQYAIAVKVKNIIIRTYMIS